MVTIKDLHQKALVEHWAVPHFNFSSLAQLHGIIDALRELRAPALLGTSEGEREFVGLQQAVYLVRSFREKDGLVVFLNADHSYSVNTAKKAIDAGYDSIHIDLSKKDFKENINGTKEVVQYARKKNININIEGELGYLVTDSSRIYKEAIEIPEESYTKIDEAVEYIKSTGVDRFAPAVGNIHGIAANKPLLRFDLIESLRGELPSDLVLTLHGGSGIAEEDMRRTIELGFNNVHISTELRVAYADALRATLKEKPDEVAPYRYLGPPRAAVAKIVKQKLDLFGAANKA